MSELWNSIFDRIYVVSLPTSSDRREYVSEHLNANGISDFEWHDAFDPKHPQVMQVYDQGSVHQYPPCFRCGKAECGSEDCNNVLLPVQVAVFMTYMNLWKKIATRGERALVFEDDVHLHQSLRIVLPSIKAEIQAGSLPFHAQTPCLLRMGWALGQDHDKLGPVRVESTIRMSNPCFGVTSAYAAKAVSHFKKVNHTADVYFHQQLPDAGEAFTVFPPIASELSWSTGQVPSLIHPKDIHADYLETQGDHEAAAAERAKIQAHPKHMYNRKFLVTGHPRTGTGYLASLLRQLEFDVGHEKSGADGLSSWMFAADSERYPYAQDNIAASRRSLHWETLLHVVRDPLTAIPSIMRDNVWAPPSYQFRRDAILKQMDIDLDTYSENFERAVISLVCWTRMILEMKPDCWVKVEDAHETLPRFLKSRELIDGSRTFELLTKPVNADKLYQGVQQPKPMINKADWTALSAEATEGLHWYCDRFGYSLPWGARGS